MLKKKKDKFEACAYSAVYCSALGLLSTKVPDFVPAKL